MLGLHIHITLLYDHGRLATVGVFCGTLFLDGSSDRAATRKMVVLSINMRDLSRKRILTRWQHVMLCI